MQHHFVSWPNTLQTIVMIMFASLILSGDIECNSRSREEKRRALNKENNI